MSRMRPVAVIIPNLLHRLGLQEIIGRYFSLAGGACSFENVEQCGPGEDYSCFVTDAATYISQSDFFLPRRSRSAVLVPDSSGMTVGDSPVMISEDSSLEEMIDSLGGFFDSIIKMQQDSTSTASQELSAREIQVLQLVVSGVINKDIADRLNISMNTVLTHRKNITAKLGIKTISGLTLYALMNGYISPE